LKLKIKEELVSNLLDLEDFDIQENIGLSIAKVIFCVKHQLIKYAT